MSLPHVKSNSPDNLAVPVEIAPSLGGTPRESAFLYRQQLNNVQNNMNKTIGGKKMRGKKTMRKHNKYLKGGAIEVPQFYNPGPSVSAGNQTANSASQNSNSNLLQANSYSRCDSCIGDNSYTKLCQSSECNPQTQTGGKCGNSGLIPIGANWNCMSGGKLKVKRSKKSKKTKKSYKNNRKVKKTKGKNKKSKKIKRKINQKK